LVAILITALAGHRAARADPPADDADIDEQVLDRETLQSTGEDNLGTILQFIPAQFGGATVKRRSIDLRLPGPIPVRATHADVLTAALSWEV
jgi:hypothetical protein